MKRDMDLVREILLKVQARTDIKPSVLKIEGRDEVTVARHVQLLHEAGLLEGVSHKGLNGPPLLWVTDLSWNGHDFIAALENDGVWNRIKASFSSSELANMPLAVLKTSGSDC